MKRQWAILFVFCFSSLYSQTTQDIYNLGKKAMEQKEYSYAILMFTKCIDQYPKLSNLYIDRAEAEVEIEYYSGALIDFNQALKIEKDDKKTADILIRRGKLFLKVNKSSEAEKDFISAAGKLVDKTEQSLPFYWLGRTYLKMNDSEKAKNAFKFSLFLDSNNKEAEEAIRSILLGTTYSPNDKSLIISPMDNKKITYLDILISESKKERAQLIQLGKTISLDDKTLSPEESYLIVLDATMALEYCTGTDNEKKKLALDILDRESIGHFPELRRRLLQYLILNDKSATGFDSRDVRLTALFKFFISYHDKAKEISEKGLFAETDADIIFYMKQAIDQ